MAELKVGSRAASSAGAEQPVSGRTLRDWMAFIEQKRGREILERVMGGLRASTREEFGSSVSPARNYSQASFTDFCRSLRMVCGSWEIGAAMGEHDAVRSEPIIRPILKSAKGDVMYFLKRRLVSIHRLYVDSGTLWFEESGPSEGVLCLQGFAHNEMLCHSIAGYSRKCLDLVGARGAAVLSVGHSAGAEQPCRIGMRWDACTET
jgi:hypothetical protein